MKYYNKLKRIISGIFIHKKVDLTLNQPYITFSFDDCHNSAFHTAAIILKKYGYAATYYISLGIKDNHDQSKSYFDTSYLHQIVNDGGELASHTFNHIHLYKATKHELQHDMALNAAAIDKVIPGYTFKNFSYPYGEQSFLSKAIIKKHFRSARGVQSGINLATIDLNNLKAVELTEALSFEKVRNYIDKTIQQKGWLILYTHDVVNEPSPYGCSPAYFEQVVAYCAQKKIAVRTIDQVLDII